MHSCWKNRVNTKQDKEKQFYQKGLKLAKKNGEVKLKKADSVILKRMVRENSLELVMRITSVQYVVICT